jgi:hypothetical protein
MQQQDDERSSAGRPHPLNQRNYQGVIDQQFAQAEAAGMFTNLPGQGRPLNLNDDANVPEDERLGYRMLHTSGFAPPWMEARSDIDEERRRIDGWLNHANDRWSHLDSAGREKLVAEFRRKLDALSSMILDYNLRVPPSVGQMRGIELTKELARLGNN